MRGNVKIRLTLIDDRPGSENVYWVIRRFVDGGPSNGYPLASGTTKRQDDGDVVTMIACLYDAASDLEARQGLTSRLF